MGGDAAYNAKALRAALIGDPSPYRDIILMNAGAALVIAGISPDMHAAIDKATILIDSGAALNVLENLIEVSNAGGSND